MSEHTRGAGNGSRKSARNAAEPGEPERTCRRMQHSLCLFGCLSSPRAARRSFSSRRRSARQLPAQPKKARPPQLDELAKTTLRRWEDQRYHLARVGVKKIRFDLTVTSKGGMTGTFKGTGTYVFDGDRLHPYGRLAWEDEELTAAMRRRGFTAEFFARGIRANSVLMTLANAKVKGQAQTRGTILIVDRGAKTDGRYLLFDKAGRQIGEMIGPMKKRIAYVMIGTRFAPARISYEMPDTIGRMQIQYAKAGEIVVPHRFTETVHVRKRLLSDLTFVVENVVIDGVRTGALTPHTGKPAASRPAAAGTKKTTTRKATGEKRR